MGRTSVDVEDEVHEELKELKTSLGLKTLGDVVRTLADRYHGRGPAVESDEDNGEQRNMEEDDDEKCEKTQLISFALLDAEPKAIKYFTGLSKPCMDWVMEAMRAAVRSNARFGVFRVRAWRRILQAALLPSLMCWLIFVHFQSSRAKSEMAAAANPTKDSA